MTTVTFKHPAFNEAQPEWQQVTDVCAGERAIRRKGTLYLPHPDPLASEGGHHRRWRYQQYQLRAVFYGATQQTLLGLMGTAFRRAPVFHLPNRLQYLKKNANGSGVGLIQQAQTVLAHVLKKGRHGLLVDYPRVKTPLSRSQQQQHRAHITSIEAERIINWRSTLVQGQPRLSLVVIEEALEQTTFDGFGLTIQPQYRVLRLVEGKYTVDIWQRGKRDQWQRIDRYQPTDAQGQPWPILPFTFVGAQNNDTVVDSAPLRDLAQLNLAHYRNSADYEDSAFFVGQAQPWISGLTERWRDHLEKEGLLIGSRSPVLLPEKAAFGFAQVQPNSLVKEALDQKERQMVALGARLIERNQAVKTATQAQSEHTAQHSVLSLAANNVSMAYTDALTWASHFMAVSEASSLQLNQDFVEHTLNPSVLTALVTAWQSGLLPKTEVWNRWRQCGVISADKKNAWIAEELEQEASGLGLEEASDLGLKNDTSF